MNKRPGSATNRLLAIAGKLGGFGFAPLLVSLASVVSVPLVLAGIGSGPWVSIAVGQAVGDVARSVVAWSWNSTGLTAIAKMTPQERIQYYFASLAPRLLLLIPVLLLLVVFVMVWPLESQILALLSAVSGAVFGLSGAWVYIGSREPRPLIVYNSVPRAVSTVVGSVMVTITHIGWFFPAMLIIGNLTAVVWTNRDMKNRQRKLGVKLEKFNFRKSLRVIANNASGFVVGFFLTLRMSAPVMIAPIIAPGGAAVVALADKIIRWVNTGLTPLMQFVQTGIPLGDQSVARKVGRGVKVAWIAFPVILVLVFVFAPIVAHLVSANQVHFSTLEFAALSLICAALFTGNVIGNGALVFLNKVGLVARVAVAGLIMLLALSLVLMQAFESHSVIMAFSLSEFCVCLILSSVALASIRGRK